MAEPSGEITPIVSEGSPLLQAGRSAAAWLEDLARHCSDLIVLLDQHGALHWANPAWGELTGLGIDRVCGQPFATLLAPSCVSPFAGACARVLAGDAPESVALQVLRAAVAPLDLLGTLALWRQSDGTALLRLLLHQRDHDALERSRQLLQEAQRIAQVGSWSLDLERGELRWSDEIYRIFELDPERFEPSYDTFLQCVHPEDRQLVDQAYSRSLIDRQPYAVTHRLLMPDGRIKFIAERCETSFSDTGEPLLSLGTALDITEPTLARQRLEASERKLRRLVELAPLGIVLSRLDGTILECNPAFEAISGRSFGGLTALNWSAIISDASRGLQRQQLAELRRVGSASCHQQLRHRDGRLIDLKVTSLLDSGSDHTSLVWSIVEDISSSLQVQDALEQAASVFSHCLEGIMITDAGGKILDVNEALCRISGYRREQLIGATPRRLKSDQHDAAFYEAMWQQLRSTGHWSGEIINRARDGALLPVQETISAVRGEDGEVRRYVALLADIRELKEQQRQLQELALHDPLTGLANRVLLHDRLEQAMRRVQRDGGQVLVGLLDLDGFKPVNDRHGHEAGDHLLQVLAERMQAVLRDSDTLARIGGDEFVLVLPMLIPPDPLEPLILRIEAAVRVPVPWREQTLQVSCSLGLTCFSGEDPGVTPQELLRRADQEMYRIKRAGAGRAR